MAWRVGSRALRRRLQPSPAPSPRPQGLAFRRGTHQLYSTSHDRSVKVWNVAENSYVETL